MLRYTKHSKTTAENAFIYADFEIFNKNWLCISGTNYQCLAARRQIVFLKINDKEEGRIPDELTV